MSHFFDPEKHVPRGVYVNMDFEDYLAEPSLSASGIKALWTSPLDFYTKFLKPDRKDNATPAKLLGRALHKMLLERVEAFRDVYAVAPNLDDYPDALQGSTALKEMCDELGFKKGTIAEMSEKILKIIPDCQWPPIKSRFETRLCRLPLASTNITSNRTFTRKQPRWQKP